MAKNFASLSYWSKRRIANNTVNLWFNNEAKDEMETVHADEHTLNFVTASTSILNVVESRETVRATLVSIFEY